jgi:hypothetical protein
VTGVDSDGDGLSDAQEAIFGTDPSKPDTDGDMCGDGDEVGPNPALGGGRDPLSRWDFFDVPAPPGPVTGDDGGLLLTPASVRNGAISLLDVGTVLEYVGRSSASTYYMADNNGDDEVDGAQLDRGVSSDVRLPWRSGPPNETVSLLDVAVSLQQVGASCSPLP